MSVDLLSVRSFSVARVLMAFCVFLCHCFECLNYYGFLFVGVFFFMSGYGMELRNRRFYSLLRVRPYLLYFFWFSLLYMLLFSVFPYPSSWFLIVYFVVMLMYRFISNWLFFVLSLIFLSIVFFSVGMYGWSTSFGAFFFGMVFTRIRFDLRCVLCFLPLTLFLFFHFEFAAWGFIPFFSWVVFSLSSMRCLRFLSYAGDYTFYFYCVHCLVLGLFGATWTLGGSPSVLGCIGAFFASVGVSVFLKDYLFNYPKIQKVG